MVDTSYTPESSLLTNIEGSPWIVNYWQQVVADDNAIAGQQYSRDAVHQQYRLILEMELRVTNPITHSQITETKQSQVTGGSNVYPFIIPNVGDMFSADIGDGHLGLYQVTTSEKRSLYKESVHYIEYTLIGYATPELLGDLQHKTVDTLQFVRDFLQYGQNPLVEPEDYANIKKLHLLRSQILEQYLTSFTSNEFKTLILPGQKHPIYDHFLTKAIKRFFTHYDTHLITPIRILNCDGDDHMSSSTIWDVLAERNKGLLKFCSERYGLISSQTFSYRAMHESIRYSGIPLVIYPLDPDTTVDEDHRLFNKVAGIEKIQPVPGRKTKLSNLFPSTDLPGFKDADDNGIDIPNIHPVLIDDYYILSKNFYDEIPGKQSRLELCIRDFINGKPQDVSHIINFCDQYYAWGGLERFYYTPLLLILIWACVRRF